MTFLGWKLLEIVQILSLYNCYKVDRNFVLINSCVDCSNKTSDMMSIQALPPTPSPPTNIKRQQSNNLVQAGWTKAFNPGMFNIKFNLFLTLGSSTGVKQEELNFSPNFNRTSNTGVRCNSTNAHTHKRKGCLWNLSSTKTKYLIKETELQRNFCILTCPDKITCPF